MDFGLPNAEIGWKMANGQLLFLALLRCDSKSGLFPASFFTYLTSIFTLFMRRMTLFASVSVNLVIIFPEKHRCLIHKLKSRQT